MIVVMKDGATKDQIEKVQSTIIEIGYKHHIIKGVLKSVIGVVGDDRGKLNHLERLSLLEGVEKVVPIVQPFKLASREIHNETSVLNVGDVEVGNKKIPVIAGPCSVENEQQMLETARAVKAAGASMLRGGAFKPRTSPYTFQGLGEDGLKLLKEVGNEFDLPIVTEIMDPGDIDILEKYADVLQIGAR
ncbi:MAG: 3-deoxy-7-phosphoheptulonate synthase, partial [Bacteroidetes bacterium]|nr:3-deoxy-7-phosphoheptulonate synthase [Bacteroidota bacterium]